MSKYTKTARPLKCKSERIRKVMSVGGAVCLVTSLHTVPVAGHELESQGLTTTTGADKTEEAAEAVETVNICKYGKLTKRGKK